MRVFHKGLLLIGVPLLLEIVVVAVLVFQLHQEQVETARLGHARQIARLTAAVVNQFFDTGFCISQICLHFVPTPRQNRQPNWLATREYTPEDLAYVRQKSAENIVRYKAATAKLIKVQNELRVLASHDPQEKQDFATLDKEISQLLQPILTVQRLLDEDLDGENQLRIKHLKTAVEANLSPAADRIKGFGDMTGQSVHISPDDLKRGRENIRASLYAALSMTVFVAVVLAQFFIQDIVKRLQVLRVNARRLSNQETLLPNVDGQDEIAELDRAFHHMATALTEASRKERAMIENVRDVIFAIDSQLRFKRLSPAAQQQWGYQSSELEGKSLLEIIRTEDIDATTAAITTLLEQPDSASGNENSAVFENQVLTKDGKTVDTLWSLSRSSGGGLVYGIAYDITDRKAVERLKQEFMAIVSHDLRAPLTSVVAVQQFLTMGMFGELPAPAAKKLADANNNVNRLLGLINDLLDMEKLEAGQMSLNAEPVPISTIIERSLQSVESLAVAKKITFVAQPTAATVLAEGDRIVQVIVNLLSNAVKFSPEGSQVCVSVRQQGKEVFVDVCDQGRGIPDTHLSSVFEKYKQVKATDGKHRSGSGLGLSICKLIIENHGGTIGVQSTVGAGSTFTFSLPTEVEAVPQQ